MAFVYRAEKKTGEVRTTTSQIIGPGAYVQHKQYAIKKSFAPFNSKEERGGKNLTEKDPLPGPGSYQIEKPNANEKVVVSSANDDIKIVEVPKPQANFKSSTKRFNGDQNVKVETPGPGQYDQIDQLRLMVEKGHAQNQHHQKQTIIDRLMKMNHYQSTPSIPSKLHTYGYTENENNDLALNKMPGHQYEGQLKDSVGPGQYELKDCFEVNKNKGSSWHKYQEARMKEQLSKSQLIVGPGSYDIQTQSLPLYKMKQSPGFSSKSLRSMENRRGLVANQHIKQRMVQSQGGAKRNLLEQDDDSDSEEEYVEDAVPGPGHYFTGKDQQSLLKVSRSNSQGNFGSLSKRFSAGPMTSNPIGPGEYNPAVSGIIGKNPHEIKVRNPPFLSSDTRFVIKKIEEVKPGPGAYEPRINLEDKLIQKIQKGYRGNFGSTERRFKNANVVDELPGPGAYIEMVQKPPEDSEIPANSAVFKSASNRAIFHGAKDQKPPVGSYKLNYYDIEKKVNLEPEDPDIKIKVPNLGFNTSEARFQFHDGKKQVIDEDEEELSVIKEKRKDESKFKKENKHFLSKADRFNYKVKGVQPAPGQYYDNNTNTWNKRTFNIHFADF